MMMVFEIFVLIFIAAIVVTSSATSEGVLCEKIENGNWNFIGLRKTGFMKSTAIDSPDFLITSARDETIGGFSAKNNKKLKFFPKNLGKKFPNLIALSAQNSSIRRITKEYFKGLGKLRGLWLIINKIENIDDDTFEYIPSVEFIFLGDNKIKRLNGSAFASLSKLTAVYLQGNECINDHFDGTARIAEMHRVLEANCGVKPKACGVTMKSFTSRIRHGESFDRGDFPWMVALYCGVTQRPKYFCGGSIISDRHVLTGTMANSNFGNFQLRIAWRNSCRMTSRFCSLPLRLRR